MKREDNSHGTDRPHSVKRGAVPTPQSEIDAAPKFDPETDCEDEARDQEGRGQPGRS